MAGKAATIYISEDNLTEWEQIEHKSEWVNDMLSGAEPGLERKIRKIATEVVQELAGQYQ